MRSLSIMRANGRKCPRRWPQFESTLEQIVLETPPVSRMHVMQMYRFKLVFSPIG
jgi:hypothetical protein